MVAPRTKLPFRRFGLYLVVLLAFGLVGTVTWVLLTDELPFTAEDVFPEPVTVNLEKQPRFVFPEDLRTSDLSLNRFIDRFCRVCATAKYSEFKLMLSRRADFEPSRFESMFHALKQARILSLDALPPLPDFKGQVYVLKAEYDLEDWVTKPNKTGNVARLAIYQEEGEWRIGPIPHADLARLDTHQESQPPEDAAVVPGAADPRSPALRIPRAAANQPARVDD